MENGTISAWKVCRVDCTSPNRPVYFSGDVLDLCTPEESAMRQNPLLRRVIFSALTLAAQSGHATDTKLSPQDPIVESEIKGVRFDFLKCLDLYHSKELDAQAKRFVINPQRSYRLDDRSSDRSK